MEIKKILIIMISILGSVSITYGLGMAILTGYEYQGEKVLSNDSAMLESIQEIKDGFIPDKIEPTTDEVFKGYFRFVDKVSNN